MKKVSTSLIFLFVFSSMLLLDSCNKKDSNDPIPTPTLKADAGPDQTVAAFATVTLDGSASTGEGTINYEWTFGGGQGVQESELTFLNKNTTKPTFIPPKNGTYTFQLNITQGTQFSQDQVVITVSGVISLSGTLAENLVLKDIEPGPGPDYKITADLIVPAGKAITTVTSASGGSIVIEIAESAGIMIDGGSLSKDPGMQLTFTSPTGWKGFVLSSGTLNLTLGTKIEKAAKSIFSSAQTEPAAVTAYTAGTLNLTGVLFTGSTGYDLLIPDSRSGLTTVENNVFSAAKPIKTAIAMLGKIGSNSYPTPYDYLVLSTPGAATQVGALGTTFVFQNNTKYYIDGDFTAGSIVNILSGATIYMKAGAGILLSGSSASITTTSSGTATIDGLDNAAWKGIAIGAGAQMSLTNLIIKNAGSDVFNTGSFTSTQKAAVYFASSNGSIFNCQIIDSHGYGLIIDSAPFNYVTVQGTTFTNTVSPAIKGPVTIIDQVITTTANTFTMQAGVAAVEVIVPNSTSSPQGVWKALGGANFYLLTGSVFSNVAWTLNPGVNLKFKAGKSLNIQNNLFTAIGTALSPITFDSEAGTAGTWPGILLETAQTIKLEYCQIKNGGEAFLFKGGVMQATEKANIVFNNTTNASNTFKNNTISGSGGYGILVEATKQNPDALNVANNNTFSTNTSGNVIVK